jgi:hypothetical protein
MLPALQSDGGKEQKGHEGTCTGKEGTFAQMPAIDSAVSRAVLTKK